MREHKSSFRDTTHKHLFGSMGAMGGVTERAFVFTYT